jgi:hypothetical protein
VEELDQLTSKLASYAETDQIKKILLDMLKDLDARDEIMKRSLADAKADLEDHKQKLVKYQTQLVDLANAADKAKQLADGADLKRAKLNGESKTVSENYKVGLSSLSLSLLTDTMHLLIQIEQDPVTMLPPLPSNSPPSASLKQSPKP